MKWLREPYEVFLTLLVTLFILNASLYMYLKSNPEKLQSAPKFQNLKWRMFEKIEKPIDWFVIGDSSCNHSLNPDYMESELGGSAYNLCTFASMLMLDGLWMLQKNIKKTGPPKNVVLIFGYDTWRRKLRKDIYGFSYRKWNHWEELEPKVNLDFQETLNIFLDRYLVLYSRRRVIQRIIKNIFGIDSHGNGISHQSKNGFTKLDVADPESVLKDMKKHLKIINRHKFKISDINMESLNLLTSITKLHGIKVFIASGPVNNLLLEKPKFKNNYADISAFLSSYAAKHDHMYFVSNQLVGLPENMMSQVDHPNKKGSEIYTHRLVERISEFMELNSQSSQ